jgi:hypothetical protein
MALKDGRPPKSSFGLRCAALCSEPLGLNLDFGLLMLGLSLPAFAELAALPLGLDREAMGVR